MSSLELNDSAIREDEMASSLLPEGGLKMEPIILHAEDALNMFCIECIGANQLVKIEDIKGYSTSNMLREASSVTPRNGKRKVPNSPSIPILRNPSTEPREAIVSYTLIRNVVSTYKTKLNGCGVQRYCAFGFPVNGDFTRWFLHRLVTDHKCFIEFLKDCQLIKAPMICDKCSSSMSLMYLPGVTDGVIWECTNLNKNGFKCRSRKSIRHESWFACTRMTLAECFLLSFDILNKVPLQDTIKEYGLSNQAVSDWEYSIWDVMADYLEEHGEPIGGEGTVVEIDMQKFREHWVLGGVERVGHYGRLFVTTFEPDKGHTAKLLERWVLPGTVFLSGNMSTPAGNNTFVSSIDHQSGGSYHNTMSNVWKELRSSLILSSTLSQKKAILAEFVFQRTVLPNADKFVRFLQVVKDTIHTHRQLDAKRPRTK